MSNKKIKLIVGFFDLVNIRAINKRLYELMPVVEANLSRMYSFFVNNFKVIKRHKSGSFGFNEFEEVIITTQVNIDELLRLKNEFESEFESVSEIVDKIKPVTFLDDDSSYVHWQNKLVTMNLTYNFIIDRFNNYKIYIQS